MFLHNEIIIGESDFHKDQFFVYSGLYGVPSHCKWWCAPDKTKEIYQGVVFRLSFYNMANKIIYIEDFVVEKAHYDVTEQMYMIYAIGRSFYDFKTTDMLVPRVLTANREQPISGKQIITDIVEDSFPYLRYNFDKNLVDRIKYFDYSFDLHFNALDLLTKICAENEWEWFLRGDALFISECLAVENTNVVITSTEPESSKNVQFFSYKYVEIPGDTSQPGSWYGKNGRVLWVVYTCGGEIGGMMGMMIQNNRTDTLLEGEYLNTLFDIDDRLIIERKIRDYSQHPILVGKIFGEWSDTNKEHYQAPMFSGDIKSYTKWLRKRGFKNKYSGDESPLLYSVNVARTTPYAGNGVGIQYPELESHHILLSPAGDRENPLLGPAFYGKDETVPVRDSVKDFRLTLPGATIYIKEDGEILIEQTSDAEAVPSGSGKYVKIHADGTIDIDTDGTINIGASASAVNLAGGGKKLTHAQHDHGYTHLHQTGNMGIPVPIQTHTPGVTVLTDKEISSYDTVKTEAD